MQKNKETKVALLQLPVPPPAFFASTGNVPLASASLANAWSLFGSKDFSLELEVIKPEFTDFAGDRMIIEKLSSESPDFLGLSLYLWNSERSLFLAEQVKKKVPGMKIILGGPEVSPDNFSLIEESIWDYSIVGEAEDSFVLFLTQILGQSKKLIDLPGLGFRNSSGKITFNPLDKIDFPLTKYPSPYLTDWIDVNPLRSTYIETVRGCRSKCTYCFYPKSSNALRGLSLDNCSELFKKLKERGASELVFLDPTFNHRPGFEELLDILIDVNHDGQMKMFGELRSEGLNIDLIKKLKKAGFYRIEIGMQSINRETLNLVKRYGNPEKVAEVGRMLVGEGIDVLLDLIVGLPGDKPMDVLKGVQFFMEHELGDYLQIFPLSVLPGTAMRADAESLGLVYMKTPPYRVFQTPNFHEGEIANTLLEAESILNRRIDEVPRPYLVEPSIEKGESIYFNPDEGIFLEPKFTTRHFQFWIEEDRPENRTSILKEKVQLIWEKEPYSTIDFIFYVREVPSHSFLLNFRDFLSSAKMNFLKFSLQHRKEDMQHRLIVLLKEDSICNPQLLDYSVEYGYLYQDMKCEKALMYGKHLGIDFPNARIIDKELDNKKLKELNMLADPEAISFLSRELERIWTLDYLQYGESD